MQEKLKSHGLYGVIGLAKYFKVKSNLLIYLT